MKPGGQLKRAAVAAAVAGVLAASAIWFFHGRASRPGAPSAPLDYAALPPMVAADASLALGFRGTSSPGLQPFVDAMKEALGATGPTDDEQRLHARRFLEESGLLEADVRWAVMSAGPVTIAPGGGLAAPPDVFAAVSFAHDLAALVETYNRLRFETSPLIEPDGEVAGLAAWRIRLSSDGGEPPDGAVPILHYASLGGEILLGASSRAALERLIAFYRGGGEDASSAFGSALSDGGALTLFFPQFGEMANLAMEGGPSLARFDALPPDMVRKILSLGGLTLTVAAGESGGLKLRIALDAASEKDADEFRALVALGLVKVRMDLRAAEKKADTPVAAADIRLARESAQGTSVKAEGSRLVVSVPVSEAAVKRLAAAASSNVGRRVSARLGKESAQ